MQPIEQLYSEYDRMLQTCSNEELESWLIAHCETAEKECPEDRKLQSALYSELGSFYKHRGRFEEGEKAFLKAKTLLEEPGMEKDLNYATVINNLAGNYRLQGKFDEAVSLFRQAIELYRQYPETPKELASSAYNNLALVYLDTGKFQEAAEMLQAACDEMKDIPECYYEKATAYANMAIAYYKCGQTELVGEKMQLADELYQQGQLENTPEYQAFIKLKAVLVKE